MGNVPKKKPAATSAPAKGAPKADKKPAPKKK
jgi:hypothetical protein